MLPALEGGAGDERLDRAVARARALAGEGGGDDGVGDRQGQVLVGVDADLGGGLGA